MHYKVVTVARLILEEVRIENRNRNVDRYIAMYIDRWINTYQKKVYVSTSLYIMNFQYRMSQYQPTLSYDKPSF